MTTIAPRPRSSVTMFPRRVPPMPTIRVALLLLVAGACTIERPAREDDAVVLQADSVVVTAAGEPEPAVVLPDADSLAALAADTPAVLPAPEPAPVPVGRDTTAVVATPEELRALAGTLIIPVDGVKPTDLRDSYADPRGGRVHEAVDILAPRNTPVRAATDGRLLKLHDSRAGGLMIYASDAADRFVFMYGHLERYADGLSEGMPLQRGQVIGYVGTSGNAPPGTPHLHFVVARGRPSASWWRGTPVNPYPLLGGAAR